MTMVVKGPGGTIVKFPDGTDQETIDEAMRQVTSVKAGIDPNDRLGLAAGKAAISPAENVPALIGSSLSRGALAIPGLPGDIIDMGARAIDTGVKFFGGKGLSPAAMEASHILPTTSDLVSGWEKMTGTPMYEPQTTAGKVLGAGLSLMPGGMVSMLGAGRGAMRNAFRYGFVPGAISETAGQAADQLLPPPLANAVRVGAAAVTGGRAMMKDRPIAIGQNANELKAEGAKFFEEARARNVVLTPDSFGKFVDSVGAQLYRDKINKGVDTNSFRVLTDLENMKGAAVDLEELKRVRSIASAGSVDLNKPYDAKLSGDIRAAIDDYVGGLTGKDTLAGDVVGVPEMLSNGRALWTQMHKSEDVNEAIRLAKISDAWSKGNEDQALRNAFRPLAAAKDFTRRYTAEEQKAILDVLGANGAEKLARILGGGSYDRGLRQGLAGMGVGGVVGGLLSGGSTLGAGVGATLAPFVAAGAERVANTMTKRQTELVQALIGGGEAEGALAKVARRSRNAVLGAYLLNMTANRPGHKSEAR